MTEPDVEDRFTLRFSLERLADDHATFTGIFVRGQLPDGGWESADIAYLTAESLLIWLHGRGGCNPWAENVVGIMLGHGHLNHD